MVRVTGFEFILDISNVLCLSDIQADMSNRCSIHISVVCSTELLWDINLGVMVSR